MKRTILFTGTKVGVAKGAYKWIRRDGGTLLMHSRSELLYAIGAKDPHKNVKKRFEKEYAEHIDGKYGNIICLGLIEKYGYIPVGPRMVVCSPSDSFLIELEQKLNAYGNHNAIEELVVCTSSIIPVRGWAAHYLPTPSEAIPSDWDEFVKSNTLVSVVSPHIEHVLGEAAKNSSEDSDNGSFEKEMRESLKAELKNNWDAWTGLDEKTFRRACSNAGVTLADTNWLWERYTTKANDGHMTYEKIFATYYPFSE